jgi:hypothetical protein
MKPEKRQLQLVQKLESYRLFPITYVRIFFVLLLMRYWLERRSCWKQTHSTWLLPKGTDSDWYSKSD